MLRGKNQDQHESQTQCFDCSYQLKGLSNEAICPECGSSRRGSSTTLTVAVLNVIAICYGTSGLIAFIALSRDICEEFNTAESLFQWLELESFHLLATAGIIAAVGAGGPTIACLFFKRQIIRALLLLGLWMYPVAGTVVMWMPPNHFTHPGLGNAPITIIVPGGRFITFGLIGIALYFIPVLTSGLIFRSELKTMQPGRSATRLLIGVLAMSLGVLSFGGIQYIYMLDWTVGLDLYLGHGNEWIYKSAWFYGLAIYAYGSLVIFAETRKRLKATSP